MNRRIVDLIQKRAARSYFCPLSSSISFRPALLATHKSLHRRNSTSTAQNRVTCSPGAVEYLYGALISGEDLVDVGASNWPWSRRFTRAV